MTTTMTARRRASALLAAVGIVLGVILSILGSHALDAHGASAYDQAPGIAAAPEPSDPAHGLGGETMLCCAMLAAAASALLLRLPMHRGRASSWRPARASRQSVVVSARSATVGAGPPPAWRFSVIRC